MRTRSSIEILSELIGASLHVLAQNVRDLPAHFADWVQGRARVLKDHGNLPPPQIAHFHLVGLAHVDTAEHHRAFGDAPSASPAETAAKGPSALPNR